MAVGAVGAAGTVRTGAARVVRSTGNVSFGSVVALMGKPKNVQKFNNIVSLNPIYRSEGMLQKDVTSYYLDSMSTGLMSEYAKNGKAVVICITGNDIDEYLDRKNEEDSLDELLSRLATYVIVDNSTPEAAAHRVFTA